MVDEETLEQALLDFRNSTNWKRYQKAVRILEAAGLQAVDGLIIMLHDDNSRLRTKSLSMLREILEHHKPTDKQKIVDALIRLLDIEDYFVTRDETVDLLGQLGGEQVFDVLANLLQTGDEDLHEAIFDAFGYLKDRRAVPILLNSLPHDDWHLRRAVIWALGEIGDETVVDALAEHIANYSEFQGLTISQVAEAALEKIGTHQALSVLATWKKLGDLGEEND